MPSWQGNTSVPLRLDAGHIRSLLLSHPGRQFCRHFRAFPALPTDPNRGTYPTGASKFVREEVSFPADRPTVVFDQTGFSKSYRDAFGMVEEGSVAIAYQPDLVDLAPDDWVMPWGMVGDGSDAPKRSIGEVIQRGNTTTEGSGSVSVSGSVATFTDSQTGLLRHGDILSAAGGRWVVDSLTTSTTVALLATIVAPSVTVAGAAFLVGRDVPLHNYAAVIDRISIAGGASSPAGLICTYDGASIVFNDATTLGAASAYSIRYRAVPKYVIKSSWVRVPGFDYDPAPDLPIGELPHVATATLVIPETYRGAS